MSTIKISHLSFAYPGQPDLFNNSSFSLDASWKLGLLGRNGRGKTTLLKLLQKKLPYQGEITAAKRFTYYPLPIDDPSDLVWNNLTVNFPQLASWQVERELSLLQTDSSLLWQPFNSLSGGEQTRAMLATIFALPGYFPLLDEPTNHLDQQGRQQVASYLQHKKTGFIITSHDQSFLDQIIDHTLVIERQQLILEKGNYSDYFNQKHRRDTAAINKNNQLKQEIDHLKRVQQTKNQWAQQAEREKQNNSHADKGFIGAKAAKLMKKSTLMKKCLQQTIDQKTGLLQAVEQIVPLTMNYQPTYQSLLIQVDQLGLAYPNRTLFNGLSFELQSSEQLVITANNGQGKSSLFAALLGHFPGQQTGQINIPSQLKISQVCQSPAFQGSLQDYAKHYYIDYNALLNLLHKLGMLRQTFALPVAKMSMGQQKKVELARSLIEPANLYLWDEPLNFLDTYNQTQIIQVIKQVQPPMLIIEHDQHFIDEIASDKLPLK